MEEKQLLKNKTQTVTQPIPTKWPFRRLKYDIC